MLALGLLAGSPEYEVYDGLVEAVAWSGQVLERFDGELGPLSCRWYQSRGVLRALPWRVARRRSGSRMVVGVRGECSGCGGSGWVGCRGPARLRRCMGGPGWVWLAWEVPGDVVGERWALRCRGWLWREGLALGPGGLPWCSGGLLEAWFRLRCRLTWSRPKSRKRGPKKNRHSESPNNQGV